MAIRNRNRSSWLSGSRYVPSWSTGFCVAITMNGASSRRLTPSAVIWRSSIASSSADWVFGEARLISSASTMLAKSGPGFEAERLGGALVDADADEVGRQQIGRELDPLPAAVDRGRQRLGQAGLADAGHVLDEEVPFGEQAHHRQLDRVDLAVEHLGDVRGDRVEQLAERPRRRRPTSTRRRARAPEDVAPACPSGAVDRPA